MLSFAHVAKSFDDTPVLRDITFAVAAGARTALVGPNGVGKTTLLRIAAGSLQPDAGTVRRPAHTAYVPQDYGLVADRSVLAFLKLRSGVLQAEQDLRAAEAALAADAPHGAERYAGAFERYEALTAWSFAATAEQALAAVDLPAGLLDRDVGSLSGGEQVRIGLAGVLASQYDAYLLDEPTNSLDLPALDALEAFVVRSPATFLIVSHDRAFLAAVATTVVEIDEHERTAEVYGVGFALYRELREQALAARHARYRAYVDEVERLRTAAGAHAAAAARTRDRRPPRDGDKHARHFFAQRASEQAARAQRRLERRLEQLDAQREPRTGWELRLSLEAAQRGSDRVAEVLGAVVQRGEFTLGPVSLDVRWGERVALLGRNGSGKTTLLEVITGTRAPDAGQVRRGPATVFGVLRQGGLVSDDRASGLASFQAALGWPEAQARTLLAKFDLRAEHVHRPVGSYSPGERCRLGLAILMARGANCLVLDEPTSHLDLEATEQLEQALQGFDGTLLVVSHDRAFSERIGLTRRITLAGGLITADEPC